MGDRHFQIELQTFAETYRSERFEQHSGVVQGSNIGPLLFLTLINDLLADMSDHLGGDSSVCCYADDLTLVVVADSDEELQIKMQAVASKANEWSNANLLPLHPDKTKILLVAIKHHPEKGWTVHWEANHADRLLRGMGTERASVEQKFQMASSKAEGNWE